jgi:hypothetical protein
MENKMIALEMEMDISNLVCSWSSFICGDREELSVIMKLSVKMKLGKS